MISAFAFLSNILLASVVLAVPSSSSRLEARLAGRSGERQSQPINRAEAPAVVEYSTNWAGALWDKSNGTFTTITATITTPTPSGSNGSASAWVGIDGYTCTSSILQTGVDFTITNGQVTYAAWYEWYPDYAYDFHDFIVSAGDEIKATVIASSPTSGTAVVENLTTGKIASVALTSKSPLCEQDAEWIVEDYQVGQDLVPFANFGTYKFTNAIASGPDGISYTPDGATLINIRQNNVVFTSVSASKDTLNVKYSWTLKGFRVCPPFDSSSLFHFW